MKDRNLIPYIKRAKVKLSYKSLDISWQPSSSRRSNPAPPAPVRQQKLGLRKLEAPGFLPQIMASHELIRVAKNHLGNLDVLRQGFIFVILGKSFDMWETTRRDLDILSPNSIYLRLDFSPQRL